MKKIFLFILIFLHQENLGYGEILQKKRGNLWLDSSNKAIFFYNNHNLLELKKDKINCTLIKKKKLKFLVIKGFCNFEKYKNQGLIKISRVSVNNLRENFNIYISFQINEGNLFFGNIVNKKKLSLFDNYTLKFKPVKLEKYFYNFDKFYIEDFKRLL